MANLTYRPEIDGLRAIAILSVMTFHLNPSWLTGGFLGVDVFFVLSGFLITKIITTEIEQGTFSFASFYNRRIKRIYPVFILVLALASIFSALFFIRYYAENLRKTIEIAVLFFSNYYLSHKQGYFDLSVNQNPIVHIWSLAVEEQYYILLPILFVFAYKKFQTRKVFFILVIGLFLLFLASTFIPTSVYTKNRLYTPYYLSHFRFPELLIGSFLALLPESKLSELKNKIISFSSLVGLILCFFFYHKDLPYIPGITMLLPCILTALIIYTTNTNNLVKSTLSQSSMVFIGKISYSLYLFHWPLIAATYYITNEKQISNLAIFILVILTFTLSILSYYFLENPIRKSKLTFKKSFYLLYLVPSLAVIAFNFTTKPYITKRDTALKGTPIVHIEKDNSIPSKILVIGDSHGDHLEPFMAYIGHKEGWNADIWSANEEHCDFIVDINNNLKNNPECLKLRKKMEEYPVIVYSFYYNLKIGDVPVARPAGQNLPQKDFKEEFFNTLKEVSKTKKVYVMADNISLTHSFVPSLILSQYGLDKFSKPVEVFGDVNKTNHKLKLEIEQVAPEVKWVDAQKYLGGKYYIDKMPILNDQDHFSVFGAQYMGIEFHKNERFLTPEEVENLYKH